MNKSPFWMHSFSFRSPPRWRPRARERWTPHSQPTIHCTLPKVKRKTGRKFTEVFAFWGVANTSLRHQSFLNCGFLTNNQTWKKWKWKLWKSVMKKWWRHMVLGNHHKIKPITIIVTPLQLHQRILVLSLPPKKLSVQSYIFKRSWAALDCILWLKYNLTVNFVFWKVNWKVSLMQTGHGTDAYIRKFLSGVFLQQNFKHAHFCTPVLLYTIVGSIQRGQTANCCC